MYVYNKGPGPYINWILHGWLYPLCAIVLDVCVQQRPRALYKLDTAWVAISIVRYVMYVFNKGPGPYILQQRSCMYDVQALYVISIHTAASIELMTRIVRENLEKNVLKND